MIMESKMKNLPRLDTGTVIRVGDVWDFGMGAIGKVVCSEENGVCFRDIASGRCYIFFQNEIMEDARLVERDGKPYPLPAIENETKMGTIPKEGDVWKERDGDRLTVVCSDPSGVCVRRGDIGPYSLFKQSEFSLDSNCGDAWRFRLIERNGVPCSPDPLCVPLKDIEFYDAKINWDGDIGGAYFEPKDDGFRIPLSAAINNGAIGYVIDGRLVAAPIAYQCNDPAGISLGYCDAISLEGEAKSPCVKVCYASHVRLRLKRGKA